MQITLNSDASLLEKEPRGKYDPRQRDIEHEIDGNEDTLNKKRLQSIVDRIERLDEERKSLGSDINDIYKEAASAGYKVKVLRKLIRIRKQEAAEVEEEDLLLDTYKNALGM